MSGPDTDDLEDYLVVMRSIASGALTEVDVTRPGDMQALRDVVAEQAKHGVRIYLPEEEEEGS